LLVGQEPIHLRRVLGIPREQARPVEAAAAVDRLQASNQDLAPLGVGFGQFDVLGGHCSPPVDPSSSPRSFSTPRCSSLATAPLLRCICSATSASEPPFKCRSSTAVR